MAEPLPVKVLVAGGFGVGKTTLVGAVSEIEPLTTEAAITVVSEGIDDVSELKDKTTTTVALDFGRRTIDEDMILYLFGTPGQDRYWFMWDDLSRGAVGALVLIDTRRLTDGFGPIDFFEDRELPFVVVVNLFDGAPSYSEPSLRDALQLPDHIPLLACDARDPLSVLRTLVALVEHALSATMADA